MRTLAALSGYFYAVRADSLYVNFYAQSKGEAKIAGTTVELTQETAYPWQGSVKLGVSPATAAKFAVQLRVPGWARGEPVPSDLYAYVSPEAPAWRVRVNGTAVPAKTNNGYVSITREWKGGDVVEIDFPMRVQRVVGNEKIASTRGQVAFERGPVVYCIEDVGQVIAPNSLAAPLAISTKWEPAMLGGVVDLAIKGSGASPLVAIPYFAWDNRGLAAMTVWLPAGTK